jgi:hypothetical protein
MTYEGIANDVKRKPDTSIDVGQRVRSYDSDAHERSYVEGVVEEITARIEGCRRYRIRVEKRVFDGVECEIAHDYVIPPVNGTPTTFGHITNGVVRIC